MIGVTGSTVSGTGTWTAGEDILVDTGGAVSLGSLTAGDDLTIDAGGTINLASGIASGSARDDRALSLETGYGGNIFFTIDTTPQDGSDVRISGGAANLANLSAADDVSIMATGALTMGSVRSTGASIETGYGAMPDGSNVSITATGAATAQTLVEAHNNLMVSTASLSGGTARAGNDATITTPGAVALDLTAGSGARDGASLVTVTAPAGITVPRFAVVGDVVLSATNGAILAATDINVSGTVDASGRAVTLTSIGALNARALAATAGNIAVTSGGNLAVTTAQSRGDIRLTSTSGNVTANALTTSASFGNPDATQAGPGDIIVNASGTAALNGPVDARNTIAATAANIAVNGTALGSAIALNSGNIVIDTQRAQIGALGRTSSVTFTSTSSSGTTIGGTGAQTGYSLSNAELQRSFAGDIIIVASRAGPAPQQPSVQLGTALNDRAPDVFLDTLTLAGANGQTGAMAGNIGSTGRLRIETPGKLRTIGAVSLTNLTSNNRFEILASEAIEIDAATGSISLRNAQQGLAGTLALTSEDVVAAQLALIPQIASAGSTTAISDLLGSNTGAANDDGYLRADAIVVTVSNGFYVQNSGAASTDLQNFADRRGLTVGSGGLMIALPTTSAPVSSRRIVINGRQVAPAGSTDGFITGIDFLNRVQIIGGSAGQGNLQTGLFDPLSTINGCAILNVASCGVTIEPPIIDDTNIQRDIIRDFERLSPDLEDSPESRGTLRLPFMLIQIRDPEEQAFQPVIDDPVTGSGNDDLWAVDDGKACPDGETCPPAPR